MAELEICRICLRTETKLYNCIQYDLKSHYEEIVDLKINETDTLPQYFCFECAMLLHKFHKFKEKCYYGHKVLKEILWKGPITYEAVHKIDRVGLNLESTLEWVHITAKNEYTIKNLTLKEEPNQIQVKIESIDLNNDTFIDNSSINLDIDDVDDKYVDTDNEKTVDIKNKRKKVDDLSKSSYNSNESESEAVDTNDKDIIDRKKRRKVNFKRNIKDFVNSNNGVRVSRRGRQKTERFLMIKKSLLDETKWKKFHLNEEQALEEFQARAKDEKYKTAPYQCTDCFRGYSKKEMLNRHRTLMHDMSKSCECHFCHMRFKWPCHVTKHIRVHYAKYKCMRCELVCNENTAMPHEECHSGSLKKCKYCDEEFRHSSTYYTHLRTHRSEYVCALCGSSFVSEAGLRMHKRIKHCTDDVNPRQESTDEDEDLNAFCSKCNIRFETRKAYEEHLFHSAMHAEVIEHGNETDKELPTVRKILGKKEKRKITSMLKSRNPEQVQIKCAKTYTRKSNRRLKSKPTTCHQCGKHFSTQAACMKHHTEEHPGTSFFGPTERHICEICGASLAPGSVAMHQNIHTRATVHPCSTCGKQFHSSIGLKRHLVTHTGEKPYACSLCDKRFTQSNSMKLHYRTFHLKQPYPKRNRWKTNKEDKKKVISEDSSDDPKDKQTGATSTTGNSDIDYLALGYQKF